MVDPEQVVGDLEVGTALGADRRDEMCALERHAFNPERGMGAVVVIALVEG